MRPGNNLLFYEGIHRAILNEGINFKDINEVGKVISNHELRKKYLVQLKTTLDPTELESFETYNQACKIFSTKIEKPFYRFNSLSIYLFLLHNHKNSDLKALLEFKMSLIVSDLKRSGNYEFLVDLQREKHRKKLYKYLQLFPLTSEELSNFIEFIKTDDIMDLYPVIKEQTYEKLASDLIITFRKYIKGVAK
jgi:hypothetical protein